MPKNITSNKWQIMAQDEGLNPKIFPPKLTIFFEPFPARHFMQQGHPFGLQNVQSSNGSSSSSSTSII